ncbi:pentapeptide repeat-containing protein [Bacillus sp. AK128]
MFKGDILNQLHADCKNCFGLCCVALPYKKSADFAIDKEGGVPCRNLQLDYRCGIHKHLRSEGFRGCTVYECFGAGQKVSQITYNGIDWRESPDSAKEMFEVFPIMQQLYEMLRYLKEALSLEVTRPIYQELKRVVELTEQLTNQSPQFILQLDVPSHRAIVNELLLKTSELVRSKEKKNKHQSNLKKISSGSDLIGAKLRGANLRGLNLRGALLIAADLREADMRYSDLIGADVRDADLRGTNLEGSIFLTQAQINSANGDIHTKLPTGLSIPDHWLS